MRAGRPVREPLASSTSGCSNTIDRDHNVDGRHPVGDSRRVLGGRDQIRDPGAAASAGRGWRITRNSKRLDLGADGAHLHGQRKDAWPFPRSISGKRVEARAARWSPSPRLLMLGRSAGREGGGSSNHEGVEAPGRDGPGRRSSGVVWRFPRIMDGRAHLNS